MKDDCPALGIGKRFLQDPEHGRGAGSGPVEEPLPFAREADEADCVEVALAAHRLAPRDEGLLRAAALMPPREVLPQFADLAGERGMPGRFVGGQVDSHMDHLEGGEQPRRGAILKREIEDDRPEGLADLACVNGVVGGDARIVVGRLGGGRQSERVAGLHGEDLLGLRRLRPMAFVDDQEHPLRPAGVLHKRRELEPGGIENADQD